MATRLEFHRGRPAFVQNGEPLSYACYSDPRLRTDPTHKYSSEHWRRHQQQFVDNGFRFFSIAANYVIDGEWGKTRFWNGPDDYPEPDPGTHEFCVEEQMRILLEMCPDAKVFVRLPERFPESWVKAYPDEQLKALVPEERTFMKPSLASLIARRDLCRYYRHITRYLEAQEWAEHIVAYALYPMGEGLTPLGPSGLLFDHSTVMRKTFRGYLEETYGSEAALRTAWGSEDLSFESACYPTDAEWRSWLPSEHHWPKEGKWQAVRDYMACYRDLHYRWFGAALDAVHEVAPDRLLGIDFAKLPMLGWQLGQAFLGKPVNHEWPLMPISSGAYDMGRTLDHPHLDFVNTPMDYTARSAGYCCEPEGVSDSLLLRGKVMFMENDFRTYAPDQEDQTVGAARDVADLQSMLLRNMAWSLSRGAMDYLMVAGGAYFDHEEVQEKGIAWLRPVLDMAPSLEHRETEHAIAMIIDDTSILWENGTSGFHNQAVLWQRILGLAHCGIPYRIYLFSDLEREEMPDYRVYLFPDLFQLTPERLALLRRKVLRDGRLAIFGPATGMIDAAGKLSTAPVSELLGVEMEMDEASSQHRVIIEGNDPLVSRLGGCSIYGDSVAYGPIVKPAKGAVEAAGARQLGWATTWWQVNRPGLFMVEQPDCRMVWSIAMPFPAPLLRELAREAGCHVWCERDDVVLASDTIAAVHTARPGPVTLSFPSPRPVWDLITGECLGKLLSQVTIDVKAPHTALFYTGDRAQLPVVP